MLPIQIPQLFSASLASTPLFFPPLSILQEEVKETRGKNEGKKYNIA